MINQPVLPVLKSLKEIEKTTSMNVEYVVLMEIHLSLLPHCCELLKKNNKKIIIHLDLIKGLKSDPHGVEYLIQVLDVDGIISVKPQNIERTKKLHKIAIQRLFLIDTQSYIRGLELLRSSQPDYIELLPGVVYKLIGRIKEDLGIPVMVGGLIETEEEVRLAVENGATAVTTSRPELINLFTKQ